MLVRMFKYYIKDTYLRMAATPFSAEIWTCRSKFRSTRDTYFRPNFPLLSVRALKQGSIQSLPVDLQPTRKMLFSRRVCSVVLMSLAITISSLPGAIAKKKKNSKFTPVIGGDGPAPTPPPPVRR
jgi:hypothetical protein